MLVRVLILIVLLGIHESSLAMAPIEVVALFKERAVIRTVEGQVMLKTGETSDFGATLVSANPHEARVRYKGEIYTLGLSARVSSGFVKPAANEVRLNEDNLGQYRMRGAINDHYVNFLVDTGASVVAMSEHLARQINLDYLNGDKGTVQTAQGTADAYFLRLNEVTLGGITVNGVRATVIQGGFPVDVLLGMSFLNQVNMQNSNGVLVLTAR